jgi:hypothetical protein
MKIEFQPVSNKFLPQSHMEMVLDILVARYLWKDVVHTTKIKCYFWQFFQYFSAKQKIVENNTLFFLVVLPKQIERKKWKKIYEMLQFGKRTKKQEVNLNHVSYR